MTESVHKLHLLSEYLAGELLLADRQAVQSHLKTCGVCRQELHCLRQTVAVLQRLPRDTTPADFMDKLRRRIERREAGSRPVEEQGAVESLLATLAQRVRCLGRFLVSPLPPQLLLYAGVVILALATWLWRASPEKVTVVPAPPVLLSPSPSAPASPQAASVISEPVRARTAAASAPEQPSALVASPPSPLETHGIMRTLRWRVAGSDPTVLQQQVKALVGQSSGAVIVQEEERMLVIAVPTQELSALRQELGKLGEPSSPETPPETTVAPDTSMTLLRVEFVRTPSVVSPPVDEDPPSHFDRARG
jgi:hypothetical protein